MMKYEELKEKCLIEFNYKIGLSYISDMKPLMSEKDYIKYKDILFDMEMYEDHSEAWDILLKYKDIIIFHLL